MTALPNDTEIAEAEMRGFRRACQSFQLYGTQIENNGISLGGGGEPVPRNQVMAHVGRMVKSLGEAMELTAT